MLIRVLNSSHNLTRNHFLESPKEVLDQSRKNQRKEETMLRKVGKAQLWFICIVAVIGIGFLIGWLHSTTSAAAAVLRPLIFQSPIGNPALVVHKTANQTAPRPGDAVAYTLTYSSTNPGSQAFNVRLYDFLPAGLEFVSANPPPAHNADGVLVFNAPSVGPVNTHVIIRAQVREGYEELHNRALIVADGVTPAYATHAISVTLGVPQLTITKTGYLAAIPGHSMVYLLRCRNTGDVTVKNVRVADVLPTGVVLVGSSPAPSAASLPLLEWSVGTLAVGELWQATVTVIAPEHLGVITNTLLASGERVEMTGRLFATHVISEAAILWLEKTASVTTIKPGEQLIYRLSYENGGNLSANGVVLTDTIPASLNIIEMDPPPTTFSATHVVWELGSLAAGASGQVVITATVAGNGGFMLTNRADITAPDSYPAQAEAEVYVEAKIKLYLPLVLRNY